MKSELSLNDLTTYIKNMLEKFKGLSPYNEKEYARFYEDVVTTCSHEIEKFESDEKYRDIERLDKMVHLLSKVDEMRQSNAQFIPIHNKRKIKVLSIAMDLGMDIEPAKIEL
jgi:hypothetical protein